MIVLTFLIDLYWHINHNFEIQYGDLIYLPFKYLVIKKFIYILFLFSTLCFSQSDDQAAAITFSSQETAVNALLSEAEFALNRADFVETERLINSASEIASDPVLFARTQLLEVLFLIKCEQMDTAKRKLSNIQGLVQNDPKNIITAQLLSVRIDLELNDTNKARQKIEALKNNALLVNNGGESEEHLVELDFLNAKTHSISGSYNISNDILLKTIPKTKKLNNTFLEAEALFTQGYNYLEIEDFENAQTSLVKSIDLSRVNKYLTIEKNALYLEAQIQKELGNTAAALEYMLSYSELKEQLVAKRNAVNFTSSEIDDLQKKLNDSNVEIDELNEQISAATADATQHDYTNIMFFGIITLLSLLALSFYMNNRLRAKSNNVLKKANVALTEERDRATDAAKIKSDFLATITHELRTPMYAVTGLTHLLLEGDPKNDQIEHLETLKSSGEYLLSLIDNILDFNKLEANKMTLESIPFSLKKRIEDLTISLSEQSRKRNNTIFTEFDNDIPSRIKGDPVKISQIIINLISNAIKFTENGNIWIRASKIKTIGNKCLIHFEIEDNGKGISVEKQEMIFENFSQEETSTTREYGGTGLGLAIVKNLTQLMNSEIKIDSKIGRGSLFYFDVWFDLPDSNQFFENQKKSSSGSNTSVQQIAPIEPEAPKPVAKKTTATKHSNKEVITNRPPKPSELINKKVLIVEDNKVNQMITRKILQGKGFLCDVANDGLEALNMVREAEYDLILMDIHMPVMDGKESTEEIRKFNREIPIIALTAVALKESEKELYTLGFDDIIPKPFKVDEFFVTIQKAFSNYEIL